MKTITIDGRALAADIRAEASKEAAALGRAPGLAVVLVGEDPASETYVKLKRLACAEAGVRFELTRFPSDATQGRIVEAVRELNSRDDIDAILVQLPLPEGVDEDAVIAAIDPRKDADGFHPENVRAFMEADGTPPPLAEGILALAKKTGTELRGANAAVLANSETFAAPVKRALEREGASVTVALDPDAMAKAAPAADVVVVAIGRPGWLTPDLTRLGAAVIDVGTTRVDGRIVGDADAEALQGIASAVTPVPGGVGPVTVAMLVRNVVRLAKARGKG